MTPTRRFSVPLAIPFGAVLVLSACSGAYAQPITDTERAQVQDICRTVMGLSPGEMHFDGCVDSLGQTLAAQHDAKRLQGQREACIAKGLQPGSRDFAVCAVAGA